MGFERRGICAHTISAAIFTNRLDSYLNQFKQSNVVDLTRLTVAGVSQNAGKKGPVRKRTRSLSPDLVQARTYSVTLGDLSPESSETHSVISRSNSGMKMKIAKPTRPKYTETTKNAV